MGAVVIGSYALENTEYALPRECSDIDFISTKDSAKDIIKHYVDNVSGVKNIVVTPSGMGVKFKNDVIMDFELVEKGRFAGTSQALIDYAESMKIESDIPGVMYADPELVFMLKMSHRYLKNSSHFKKTMDDIRFLRSKGLSIPDRLQALYKNRQQETYNYGHPKLNVSKYEFFRPNLGIGFVD